MAQSIIRDLRANFKAAQTETDVKVKGSREDFHVIGPIVGPTIIGLILIFNLSGYPLYQLAIGVLAIIIELLIIRGINSEVRDGMAKLKKS